MRLIDQQARPFPSLALTAAILLAVLSAAPAAAQAWRGSAAFRIEIENRGGQPAVGVEAHLRYMELEPAAGPPAMIADATGMITFQGLAEGQWLLELYFEGTKPYAAILQVEAGKRPVMVAGPVRDAAAPPLDVKLIKLSARAPAVEESRGRSRTESRRSRRDADRRSAPSRDPVSPIPAPPAAQPPAPLSEPPAPAAEPKPVEEMAPEAEVHDPGQAPPAAPSVEPEPEMPEPELPKPAMTAPETPQVEPASPEAPMPEAAPSAAPMPEPSTPEPAQRQTAPELPAPPAPSAPASAAPGPAEAPRAVGVRTREIGDCPECKRGESAVTAVQSAAPHAGGAEDCSGHHSKVEAAMQRLLATAAPTLAGYTGPLIDPGTGSLTAAAGLAVRGEVQPLLVPYVSPSSPCQLLAVVLPATARYSGYAYGASDASASGACVGNEDCDIGLSRWTSHPVIVRGEGYTVLWGLFANRSPNRERRAALTAYFGTR